MKKMISAIVMVFCVVMFSCPAFAGPPPPPSANQELASRIEALKVMTEKVNQLLNQKLIEAEKSVYQKGVEALAADDGVKALACFEAYEKYLKSQKSEDTSAQYLLQKKTAYISVAMHYARRAEDQLAKGNFDGVDTSLYLLNSYMEYAAALGEKMAPKKDIAAK